MCRSKFPGPVKFSMFFSSKFFPGVALKTIKNNIEDFPRSLKYDAKQYHWLPPPDFQTFHHLFDIRCFSGREQ